MCTHQPLPVQSQMKYKWQLSELRLKTQRVMKAVITVPLLI